MFCLVGLGNPGTRYVKTRHNVGFESIDLIREKFGGSAWSLTSGCELSKINIPASDDAIILKPQKYMNCSGEAIVQHVRFYKIDTQNIIVFHDDLDLAPGVLKIKQGGGAAGNNGIKDIIREFGPDFIRVRIGIGHPRDEGHDMDVSSWVLTKPKPEHKDLINNTISKCPDIAESLIRYGIKETQQKFH